MKDLLEHVYVGLLDGESMAAALEKGLYIPTSGFRDDSCRRGDW